jgi:TetR/AcrR family transcriptional regulator of autoinduction and epiphytic fitness
MRMNPVMQEPDTATQSAPAPRRGAGEDPVKRRQILEGARKVISAKGFDAASMNDITRAAGVSKGTIYVYFENKEQLFEALIAEEREQQARPLFEDMDAEPDIARALAAFGRKLVKLVTSPQVLRAQRVVIGVTERMPDMGRTFYEAGPLRGARFLQAYLDRRVAAGDMDIPDTLHAAMQFLELAQAGLVRPRLYAYTGAPPDEAEVSRAVDGAVRLFMAGYGPKSVRPA